MRKLTELSSLITTEPMTEALGATNTLLSTIGFWIIVDSMEQEI